MIRILILMAAANWSEAAKALSSAKKNAAQAERLSYGLCLGNQPDEDEQAEMHALGAVMYLVDPAADGWLAAEKLWQGENYVLMGTPDMEFDRQWDRVLLDSMKWCCKHANNDWCVLTGYLPRRADPVDAVTPVAAECIDRRGRLYLKRGTPLRYAVHPLVSAFVHPGFCFAPSAFYRMMAEAEQPMFLAAYLSDWALYTLHKPVIRLRSDVEEAIQPINVSCCGEVERIERFEKRFDIHFAEKRLGSMARCGIFSHDLTFESRVPLMVRLQEMLRSFCMKDRSLMPLCTTAWLNVGGAALDEIRMQAFQRLAGMKNLTLMSYVDRENAVRVERVEPNIREFQPRHGLDVPMEAIRSDELEYIRLSKAFMLAQCRQQDLEFSHYVWLNFDYLKYPVYKGVSLDWSTVCDGCINVAIVDGQLDLSMIVVPEECVERLCRELSTICNRQWRNGEPLPTEQQAWTELYNMHSEWFHVHYLPGENELLSLTMPLRGEEYNTK